LTTRTRRLGTRQRRRRLRAHPPTFALLARCRSKHPWC
jgi:hypothetical protein